MSQQHRFVGGEPVTPLVLFGKHPSHEDFIPASASPAMNLVDEWLLEAMEWANARAAAGFPEAFSSGGIRAFVQRPPGYPSSLIVGALQPSRDRSGRRFPLVAAAELSATGPLDGRCLPGLPVLLEPLWQGAAELLSQAAADSALPRPASFYETVQSLDEALLPYREWTRSLTAAELWSGLLGSHPDEVSRRAVQLVFECVRPLRATEQPTTWLTLRLPLGGVAGAGVCFWLDLIQRATRWRRTVPSFFWCQDGDHAHLLLHLGQPPKFAIAELWLPNANREEICDLATSALRAELPSCGVTAAIPERFLASGSATVDELLEFFSAP